MAVAVAAGPTPMYPLEPVEQGEEATEPVALPTLPADRPTLAVAVAVEVIQMQESVQEAVQVATEAQV